MTTTAVNKNNSAVKRIMQEARELANDPSSDYFAAPLEDDIFEWHCTLRGPSGTEFEGGLYHFRILLPAEYPFRPPSIMILTPNGRFELNTKICISFTNYHEELWQPAWGVRTAILGLQGFFPLKGQAAIGVGSLEYPVTERKRLAALSREWVCPHCREKNVTILPDPPDATCCVVGQPEDGSPNAPPNDSVSDGQSSLYVTRTAGVLLPSHPPDIDEIPPSPPIPSSTAPQTSPADISSMNGTRVVVSEQIAQPMTPVVVIQRPPLLLDTAICVLLVLVFALICRRVI